MKAETVLVLGVELPAFPGPRGAVVLVADVADVAGIHPRDASRALPLLRKRMRLMVTRVKGEGGGPAVPLRWLPDLAGYDRDEIPAALQPLWQAARQHYRPETVTSLVASFGDQSQRGDTHVQ